MSDEVKTGSSLELLARELVAARKKRTLSVDEVSKMVDIRTVHLEKLERGDFAFLPPLYVFSILRKYAGELSVGTPELLDACRRELQIQAPAMNLTGSGPQSGGSLPQQFTLPPGSRKWIIVGAAVLAAGILLAIVLALVP